MYHDRPPSRLFNDVDAFARAIKSSLSHTKAIPVAHTHAAGSQRTGTEKILVRFLEDYYPPAQYSREVTVVSPEVLLLILVLGALSLLLGQVAISTKKTEQNSSVSGH